MLISGNRLRCLLVPALGRVNDSAAGRPALAWRLLGLAARACRPSRGTGPGPAPRPTAAVPAVARGCRGAPGMEAPRTSLNVHLPWPHTAALLGLAPADEALPARTSCPLCGRRRLHVYEDTPCGGAWFCCPDCGRCGDL